ncbi:MAG: class I SAM-dependent methyltransferase [Gemmatimonadetes bacterium]|nr:class I SAM-dependent methyltransferase [Gemmatimonadota bacterium]
MTEPWYERAFGSHYPAIYAHRNDEEAAALAKTLANAVPLPGADVLDVACGGGRHMAAIGRQGARTFGLDLSLALLRTVPETGRVARGDMRSLPFRSGTFDGACNLFTSFGYFPTRTENDSVLREVRRVLKPDGWFLFDYLNEAPTLAGLVPRSERTLGQYHLDECRSYDRDTRILRKTVVLTSPGEKDPLEWAEELLLYSPEELREAAAGAGFRERTIWGGYDGNAFDVNESDRVVLLLEPAS